MLEGREETAAEPVAIYRLTPLDLWRVADARQRIANLLLQRPDGLALEGCLPPPTTDTASRPLRVRAALASTLVAGLEMARDGAVILSQEEVFGPVTLTHSAEGWAGLSQS